MTQQPPVHAMHMHIAHPRPVRSPHSTRTERPSTVCCAVGVRCSNQANAPQPVYQDRQKLFNRIAPVYDQVQIINNNLASCFVC